MKLSTTFSVGLGLLVALSSGAAFAQTPTWTSAQSLPNAEGGRYALGVAADGSQYVTGTFTNTLMLGTTSLTAGAGAGHIFLAKYSTAGSVLWAKQLDSPAALNGKLAVDAAGNVYLAGSFTTSLTAGATMLAATSTGAEPYLLKYDAQGVAQWARQGGGPGHVNGIAIGPNGDVALAGTFLAALNFGGSALAGGGAYYYKFSPVGSVLQAVQLGQNITGVPFGENITAEAVALDTAGNAYLTGEFIGNVTVGSIALSPFVSSYSIAPDVFLCKIDGAGTVVWAQTDGDNGSDAAVGIIVDAGGNPVICGKMANISQDRIGNYNTAFKLYLARYTPQGATIWRKIMQASGGPGGQINAVAHDGRGGYAVTGWLYGSIDLINAHVMVYNTGFVIRFDSQGNSNWYMIPATGLTNDYASLFGECIAADAAGNVFVAGNIGTNGTGTVTFGSLPPVGKGMFIAALQPGAVLATQSGSPANALAVYPNPATSFVTLVLPAGSVSLSILDALGRSVREQALPATNEYVLPLGLTPGIYQLRIMLKNGQTAHRQLAVQ